MNQHFYRSAGLWILLFLLILVVIAMLRQGQPAPQEITYTEFMTRLQAGQLESVTIEEGHISGIAKDGEPFATYAPTVTQELLAALEAEGVEVTARPAGESPVWQQLFIYWMPFLILIGLWVFFLRQMQAGGGKAMSFGKSRARLLSENTQRITFDDVAGVEESKYELEEIIAFLREPKKFTRLGGRIPKGVLLVGLPGTGKTLLARAVAGEAGVPFFSISGSDFVEMFVGVGASRVRDLFLQGKKNAPCIIFIDEIDAVGRHRGAGMGGGHDEREQTLNQLLVEMDGFESNEGVILIAATNRPDVLDPALLRPGRFDRRVVVPRPDLRGRYAILKVHTRRVPLGDDVDLETIAKGTPGFVGADLQNLVNEGALLAARRDAAKVEMNDLEQAKDKVLLGAERKSMIMSDEDKRSTAYHEAGHALVAMLAPGCDPVHKVTIIPRGMALGLTQTLPEEDRYTLNRDQMLDMIKHAMGGRAAEELVFDQFSTGAENDLRQATDMARRMVCRYGMSERIGPISLGDEDHDVFLGRDLMTRKEISEKKAEEVDDEVSRMLRGLYDDAKKLLADNRETLEQVTEALLERETLDSKDMKALVAGEPLPARPPEPVAEAEPPTRPTEEVEPRQEFPGDKVPDPEPIPG
ncbi:MAG: ATP-dependent zinc metalloprotease FtsH [Deltaproteobacteria bacterium]|nr:ATP-dependent zinc metalloprotease FtsH [Deltaproteobacteria bacterium]